jgi:hypothetical protein
MAWLTEVHGTAMPREMVPVVHDVLRDSLKTRFGMERMQAWPALWCSDEALMPLVGVNAPQVRPGLCQRGATKRQGERVPGPIGPDTLANHLVQVPVRDLEAVFHGAMRALARAGVFGATVTGMVEGTELETTERDVGCGQVTRHVRQEDQQGRVPEIEVTVYGGNVLRLIDAVTKIPLAVQVAPIDAPATHGTRALGTQARANLAGAARLHQIVLDRGVLEGTDVWWLDEQGLLCVVPANTTRAVTVDARAPAAAGEGLSRGCRVPTVRHGPGQTARTERLTTAVVGITGLTTSDQ